MADNSENLRNNVFSFFQNYSGLEELGRMYDQLGMPEIGLTLRQKGGAFILAAADELFKAAASPNDYTRVISLASAHAEREAHEGGDGMWDFIRGSVAEKGKEYGLLSADAMWDSWSPAQRKEFEEMVESETLQKKPGGCYVASAVYGSYDCPEVWVLRRFRDETLMRTSVGRTFVRFYYALSPLAVKAGGSGLRILLRPTLTRIVDRLRAKGVSDEPYED